MSRGVRRAALVAGAAVFAVLAVWVWREHVAWRLAPLSAALHRVSPLRMGLCRCAPDSVLTIHRDDGLGLAASVYGVGGARGAVLLLHGLTPYGRDLPVYRVLARALADAGFVAMTLDFAGFGESDDPYVLGSEEALDNTRDVQAALGALAAIAGVDGGIVLVGHSRGAIEAMAVGLNDPRIDLVVAIGPPRRTAEILATDQGREYHWDRLRRTYDSVYHRPLPEWLTRDRFLELKAERDIERFLPRWMMPDHVPLLLVDGDREPDEDREYLSRYASQVVPPKRYVTVERADHYLNTGWLWGWIYFDRRALEAVVQTVAETSEDGMVRRSISRAGRRSMRRAVNTRSRRALE